MPKKAAVWLSAYCLFGLMASSMIKAPQISNRLRPTTVPLPGGSEGIGFDDLAYSTDLKSVIIPAGRTGNVDLINPETLAITVIAGFSAQDNFGGGHGQGSTSADAGLNVLFAADHEKRQLTVVDPFAKTIIATVPLADDPDYVRYMPDTNEVWVTEPDSDQLEIFSLSDKKAPVHTAFIAIAGGPESLVIDKTHERAYTHLWAGKTVAIDIKQRIILATWNNSCADSRGIALDEQRGFLLAGCAEGKAVVLDVNHDGRELSSLNYGSGVDVISYNPTLAHLYLPESNSATLGIVGVAQDGKLTLLGEADTASGAHCVSADDLGNAWVCDPDHGQLLVVKDPFPASNPPASTAQP